MTEFFEIFKQYGPNSISAITSVVILSLCLKHLASERIADRSANEAQRATVKEISAACHTASQEMRKAFQDQIAEIESRDEARRREVAALYDRDRRELVEATNQLTKAIASNGAVLVEIEKGFHGGRVHKRAQDRGLS